MKTYNPVSAELVEKLVALLGESNVSTNPDKLETYKTDEEANPKYFYLPEVIVFPETEEQVAGVIKLANEYVVPITPRAGGTSLVCGAIPQYGGIVLLLEKMNKIIKLDKKNLYMVVEAGARTLDIQNAAKAEGLLYAGDPCSSDSCQIGGNLATNAGGNRVVKYGATRDQVYAIRVVLPTGEIVELGARTKKNSTGYALDKLMIGSEGTLGIITQVTLKLKPLPTYRQDLLAVFDDDKKAVEFPSIVAMSGLEPTSMEYMGNKAIKSIARFLKTTLPHQENSSYIIVTLEGFDEDALDKDLEKLADLCDDAGAIDVLQADERIWKARRSHGEATRADSPVFFAEDVVVPTDKFYDLMQVLDTLEENYGIQTSTVAHIGDGNVHVNPMKMNLSDEEWTTKMEAWHKDLYAAVYAVGGLLSGEHGIGYKNADAMEEFTDPNVIKVMRSFKQAIDPNYILNPGKIFSAD